MLITLDYNKSYNKLQLFCDDREVFTTIREHFSVLNASAGFARRRNKFVASRKYAITPTGMCDLGLYYEIRKFFIEKQYCNVQITNNLSKILQHTWNIPLFTDFKFELRDYQKDVVEKALKVGRGVCVLGTGAGKTLTTAALIENYYRAASNPLLFKCLLIVPDLGLVEQTYNAFLTYGISFSLTKWTGNNQPDLNANVILCNMQVLQSQFTKNEWVKFVDLLVVDECHKIKSSNNISNLISKIKTHCRYGFTGTLPEEQFEEWAIKGKFGQVLYEKTSAELRAEDYLTNVEVKVLQIKYQKNPPHITDNLYRNELEYLQSNPFRNDLIKKLAGKLNNNTLILVNFINHGELLYEELSILENKQVFFIRGEVAVEEREKIKRLMEVSNNVVCIAISAIFSTGVDIKNLHNILFVAGGKSFIRTVQSIGRGLRKHESKNKLTIIDFYDLLNYGIQHGDKRQQIYTKEKIKFTTRLVTES